MSVNFLNEACQSFSSRKLFGLCDEPSPSTRPAYIDEANGENWIGVVENDYLYDVTFTAIDKCIDISIEGEVQPKRCDGMLTFEGSVIFVELKERHSGGNWIKDAEKQLKSTIENFELSEIAEDFSVKKAYIANSSHPKFRSSQTLRMESFLIETGYVLRIEQRIRL
ncbi:MAG: hypothetical protein LBF27_30880 [Sphingobacterium sp.]|jgi:hypothetical protein|nr:hypothetical protein [Sphingobacterium sp.]